METIICGFDITGMNYTNIYTLVQSKLKNSRIVQDWGEIQ